MTEIEADVLTSGKCVKQRKMGTAETLGNPFTADYQEVPRRIPILIYSSTLCKYVIVLGNREIVGAHLTFGSTMFGGSSFDVEGK